MTMTIAEKIQDRALADPRSALEEARGYLDELPETSHVERAITYRAMSLAARFTSQIDDSIEYARLGARIAEEAGEEELRLLALLTMSGSLAISGRTVEALDLIGHTLETCEDRHLYAKFLFQRGVLLMDVGQIRDALDAFVRALPVFREFNDIQSVGATLHNLGQLHTLMGEFDKAEVDLLEARDINSDLGEDAFIPGIEHNLGLLSAYRGDIPAALDRLTRSDELSMKISGAQAPQHVARCEVLLSAGLFQEALALAGKISAASRARGDGQHEANALLVAAHAAVLAGEPDAEALADTAAARFEEQDRPSRAAEARRLQIEARYASSGASENLLTLATSIADRLEKESALVASAQAGLLAGRIALDLGRDVTATRFLEPVANVNAGPVELRIQSRLARALLRMVHGDAVGADASARAGLRLIDDHQAALGATDLRMGVEKHGADLAQIGLGLALDSRRPRRVLAWMERTRGRALRHRPVLPSGDDETRERLGKLRLVESDLRKPEHRGDRDLLREQRRLQEEITRSDRIRRGAQRAAVGFTVDRLIESLGNRSLVEIGAHQGQLVAVVVRRGRARLIELGDVKETELELSHIRFAMRRAARMGRAMDEAALERLNESLLTRVGTLDEEVIVVPPPALMAAPWSVLPSLRDRAVTVSPSAEMWWRANRQTPPEGPVLVAGGPDLDVAGAEVEMIGSLYVGATVLPPGSSVDQVRAGLDGAAVAHIASHATFQVENPMFSALRLGDGDLNVYDIERLERPPDLVVLSACDSGYTEARAGDELAGLTSALLSMGSRNIVASVGLVPDSQATSELMVRFHRGLIAGLGPARALSDAQSEIAASPEGFVAASSFICVGG